MLPMYSDCVISEHLNNLIEDLLIKLETDLDLRFPDLVTVKNNFKSVLALSNSTSEVKPVKSCKLKIILKKLLEHGKLSSILPTEKSLLLDLTKILLQLMNDDDLIALIDEFIDQTNSDLALQSLSKFNRADINLFTFYVIDILLNSLEAKNLKCNSVDCLERILIDVILCCDNDVLCVILHHLIPNVIRFSNSIGILEEIWLSMQQDCSKNSRSTRELIVCHDEQCLSKKVSILCMLAPYYISSKENGFPLVTEEHFWFIIYCGLTDSLPFHRKKALYLLKRSIDFLEMNGSTFKCDYFVWNENQVSHLQDVWKDIIIVLEVLEEKQLHLINPILPSLMKLTMINNVVGEEILKDNWLKCVCQRLISHESSQLIKWGIVNLICTDVFFRFEYDPIFYRTIFNALNNTSLYSKSQGNDSFAIDKSLENWFLKFSYHSDQKFLRNIPNLFCDISWAPVPLFHVVKALATTSKTACWDSSTLIILKKFIIETLGTQNVHIRGAIQCCLLRCVVNLTNTKDLDYRAIFDLLSVIRSSECLRRGTESWKLLVNWFKQFIEAPTILTFLKTEIDGMLLVQNTHGVCLSMEAISRCVILMGDVGIFCGESKTPQLFTPILNLFNHTSTSNSKSVDIALKFLMNLELELQTAELIRNPDVTKELVFSLALKCMKSAMSYLEIGFKNWFGYTNELSTMQQYLSFISCFGGCEETKTDMKESVMKLVMDSYNLLADNRLSNPSLKYFSLMLVSWVAKYNCSQYKKCSSVSSNGIIAKSNQELVENLLKEQQINTIFQGKDLKSGNESPQSKLSSSCVLAGWSLLHSYIVSYEKSLHKMKNLIRMDQLIDLGLEATQIGGKDVLTEINQVFEVVLPEFINQLETETLSKFISTTWKACFELRKNELFWIIFKSWIKMFYQKTLMESEKCNALQIEYANTILELGETVGGLSNCLFKHLNEEVGKPEDLAKLPNDLMVKALVFGPVHRKDLRIESEVCNFIKSKGSEYSINILKPLSGDRDDCEVRLYVINMILRVCVGESGEIIAPKILISVMESLMEEDSRISEKKKRYYGDSHHHRIKNRIVQVLLVLEHALFQSNSYASEVFYEKLLEWLSENLSRESHQPSIRYQLQWLFVRCLLHKPRHLPKFWIMFEKGSEERAGCVCSYISIAYHLAAVLQQDEFSSRCVQEILPWCMAQHFNVRMYAQFVLNKLWSVNKGISLHEEYKVIRTSLLKSLSKGSAIKNLPKLECDFYFSNFHPMKHFSLKSIFIELPRLASVTQDEWCSEMALLNCLHSSFGVIPLEDPITASDEMKSLVDCEPATWTFKTRESAECNTETDIIQKKFVPWRDMLTEEENNIPSEQKKEGLIVVASLIDRPPNLGGLSRTCEVFGVSELVLNSLHYLTDKQFTSLSMSSEKHVNITEVKEYHMADYIQKMKQSGFTVVGAEQTPGSIQLTKFKFPCKTVLILGNEKEGIPANMLPLLDACIVVPQYGLVRSLNVHVTGALFIWEYAKQYK